MPLKVRVDWNKLEVCKECAEKLSAEISKQLKTIKKGESPKVDIINLLCDECLAYNSDNGAIKIEIDPRLVRK